MNKINYFYFIIILIKLNQSISENLKLKSFNRKARGKA